MTDKNRSYFDMSPEEVYATFLSALAGLEDDASMEGFSPEGLHHLQAALAVFQAKFKERHGDEG